MRIHLLPEKGRFYKANLHCHTNLSDGQMSPEEVKDYYRSMGYDAVCFTDHEVLIGHKELCDEHFVALHGYEVAIKQDLSAHTASFMPVYHLNLIAEKQDMLTMPRYFLHNPSMPGQSRHYAETVGQYDPEDIIETTVYDPEWVADYVEAVSKKGFLVTYNHPQWSLQTGADYLALRGLHAIEVINGACYGVNDNTSLHFEQMLRDGIDVIPVGGDDNHAKPHCGLAYTMIKAEELTYDALIEAYKKGDVYASEGPELRELYIEDDTIVIKTSPVQGIFLMSEGRAVSNVRSYTKTYTEVRFPYTPQRYGRYFRIELADERGRKAYSRAYYVEEIS